MSINYPYMPDKGTIEYVLETDPFMQEARLVAETKSTDSKQPTGAVIVKEGVVVASAANQSALRNETLLAIHKKLCPRKLLKIKSGTCYWICPGCATHAQHAESRVIREAVRGSIDVRGASVYLWGHWWCCKPCWNAALSVGVSRVYLLHRSEILFNKDHIDNVLNKSR